MASILDSVVRINLERAPFRERPERSKIMNGADTHGKSCHNRQIPKAGPGLLCSTKNSSRLRVGHQNVSKNPPKVINEVF